MFTFLTTINYIHLLDYMHLLKRFSVLKMIGKLTARSSVLKYREKLILVKRSILYERQVQVASCTFNILE